MMNKNEPSFMRFIKSTLIFFAGTVLSKLINILLLPLYTSHIPTGEMGYYDLSLTYVTVGTSILFIDIWVAILRNMYDCKTSKEKDSTIKSGFVIFIVSSSFFIIVGLVCSFILHIENAHLIFLYGISHNISIFFAYCARGYGKNIDFSISGIINTIVNVACNLLFILVFSMGYEALYIASVIGYLAQILYLSIRTNCLKAIIFSHIDKELVKSMFKYSLPLCVNSVSYWLLTSFNRSVVNWTHGDSMSGLLAVGAKFGMLIALVTTCFTLAWQDLAFSTEVSMDENKKGSFYSNACNIYGKVLLIATALLLPIVMIAFPYIVKGDYTSVSNTIPLFLIVAILSAFSTFIGNVFYAIKDTKTIFISMVISAVINLAICYPLIFVWKINGSNIAVAVGFLSNIIIRSIILKKKIGFKIDLHLLWYAFLVIVGAFIYLFANKWINLLWFVVVASISIFLFRDYLENFISMVKNKVKQS